MVDVKDVVRYGELGWCVFPLKDRDKVPACKWADESTNDKTQVAQWLATFSNFGLDCGKSNIVVLDFDDYKGNVDFELTSEDLDTVSAKTGSGGVHYFYKADEQFSIKNSTSKLAKNLDVRGNGGYVVLAPSIHPNGNTYQWGEGCSPFEKELKPVPQVIIDKLKEDARSKPKVTEPAKGAFSVEVSDIDKKLVLKALESFDGNAVSYDEWLSVYIALAGVFSKEDTLAIMSEWGTFTSEDRYKIEGFSETPSVTIGTIFQYAKKYGNFDLSKERSILEQENLKPFSTELFSKKNSNNDVQGETSVTTAPSDKITTQPTEIGKVFHPFIVELGKDPTEVIDRFLKVHEVSDIGNAMCVYDLYGDVFRTVKGMGLLYYNGKYWDGESADSYLQEAVINTLTIRNGIAPHHADIQKLRSKTAGNSGNITNAKTLFSNLVELQDKVDDYNSSLTYHLLNCQNGVINLKTGELLAHSPEYKFTYCVPADYDPDAKSAEFDNFLANVVGHYDSQEVKDYLQMAVGYTISGHTYEECLFYFFGPSRSGKGTFITIFSQLLGNLSYGTNFNTFTKKRDGNDQGFDYAPMWDKRLITASESNKAEKMNEAAVKNTTGRDAIRASFKGKDHFSFIPKFKIWVSSNNPPAGDVDDDAFWGRLRLIVFPNSYLGNEDKALKDRLLQPENLKAVLTYAVAGAVKYFNAKNGLNVPQVYKDALDQKRDEQDIVNQFLTDEGYIITGNEDNWVNRKDLYNEFENWCTDNSVRPWAAKTFNSSLAKKGCPHIDKQKKTMNSVIRTITGIKKGNEDADF